MSALALQPNGFYLARWINVWWCKHRLDSRCTNRIKKILKHTPPRPHPQPKLTSNKSAVVDSAVRCTNVDQAPTWRLIILSWVDVKVTSHVEAVLDRALHVACTHTFVCDLFELLSFPSCPLDCKRSWLCMSRDIIKCNKNIILCPMFGL